MRPNGVRKYDDIFMDCGRTASGVRGDFCGSWSPQSTEVVHQTPALFSLIDLWRPRTAKQIHGNPNLQAYSETGLMVSTTAVNNMGTIELLTSDSVAISPTTLVNSVNSVVSASTTAVTTPEPATLALFAVGGLALMVGARRRKNKA